MSYSRARKRASLELDRGPETSSRRRPWGVLAIYASVVLDARRCSSLRCRRHSALQTRASGRPAKGSPQTNTGPSRSRVLRAVLLAPSRVVFLDVLAISFPPLFERLGVAAPAGRLGAASVHRVDAESFGREVLEAAAAPDPGRGVQGRCHFKRFREKRGRGMTPLPCE